MTSIFPYLLTASALLAVLYAGYYFLLRKQKGFMFTRIYLLGSLLLSLLHPLLSGLLPGSLVSSGTLPLEFSEQYLPAIIISPQSEILNSEGYSPLLWCYLAGCGLAGILFLVRLAKLGLALRQLHFRPGPDGFLVAHNQGGQPTFSFFHYLALNPALTCSQEEYQLVLQHEQTHARQLHSADVLLGELATIILWFHPGMYLLNRALRQTHEHLADAAVLKSAASPGNYISLMARQGLAAAGLTLSSSFFQSFTINRIRMIKNTKSPFAAWRMAAAILMGASLTTFVACEKENQLPPPPPPMVSNSQTTAPPPPPTEIFDIVEDEAMPVGGLQAFYQYLGKNISYPSEALKNNINGTAYIRFVIDEQGNVSSAETVEGRELGYGLDEEAIRVIKSSKWTPAKQRGIIVKQRKILPVKFSLGTGVTKEEGSKAGLKEIGHPSTATSADAALKDPSTESPGAEKSLKDFEIIAYR
jgi:TonB family protein